MSTVRDLIDQILTKNKEQGSVSDSVTTTLVTLVDAFKIAGNMVLKGDPRLFQDLVSELDSNVSDLTHSVVVNTPVANDPKSDTIIQPLKPDTPLESNAAAGAGPTASL